MEVPFGEFMLREYEPGDEERIVPTFNRVFAAVDPGFVPRSLEFWRWQFAENPSGQLTVLAFSQANGDVVAQHAMILSRILLEGRPTTCGQVVDSMADPAYRRGLTKTNLPAHLANTFIEIHGGPNEGQQAFYWGAPVPVAWRVGKSFIRYEIVRTLLKLSAAPVEVRDGISDEIELEEVTRFPAEVDELFARVAPAHALVAVRDRAQLDWRFADHPEHRYRIALARRAGALVGYAVYRRGAFDSRPDEGLLCDWWVPSDEPAAGESLRAWTAGVAKGDGVERLTALFSDRVPEWLSFQRAGFRVAPSQYPLVARNCLPQYDMAWMNRHWYYTLSDTDLV